MRKILTPIILLSILTIFAMSWKVEFNENDENIEWKSIILEEDATFPSLEIPVGNADVNVTGSKRENVVIEVMYWEAEEKLRFALEQGVLKEKAPRRYEYKIKSITALVPETMSLNINTGNGDILIKQMRTEDIVTDTGNGSVSILESYANKILCDTGNGEINLTGVENSDIIRLDSGNGDIQLNDCSSINNIYVDTGNGSVSAINVVCENFIVDTGLGNIMIQDTNISKLVSDTGMGKVRIIRSQIGTHYGDDVEYEEN